MTDAEPQPRRRRTIAATVGVVVLIAAVAGVIAWRRDDKPAASAQYKPVSVPLPTPHTITRDGATYTVQVIPTPGLISTPTNARTLDTYLFNSYSAGQRPACNTFKPSMRVVAEDARSVTIASFNYSVKASGTVGCTYSGTIAGVGKQADSNDQPDSLERDITITLQRPLGNRALVDAQSGKRIAVFAPHTKAPVPAYLPSGYQSVEAIPVGGMYGPGALSIYQGANGSIEIHLDSASTPRFRGTVIGKDTVAGNPAAVTDESYERCVNWTKPDGESLQVCSLDGASHHFLSADELLKVARSMK